jgi:hypothetical protein
MAKMAHFGNNISTLRQQAFDILNYLLGSSIINADSGAKWSDLILRAASEADLNNLIGALNAVAASDNEPHFIDDHSHNSSYGSRIDPNNFRIDQNKFKFNP